MKFAIPTVMAAIVVASTSAQARPTGVLGRWGTSPAGFCADCHNAGTGNLPTVEFISAPTTVEVSETVQLTFRITRHASATSQTHAGFNVAASDGVLAAVSSGTTAATSVSGFSSVGGRLEVTHTQRHQYSSGSVDFTFDWTAPATAGTSTLWGAGNSVNNGNGNSGDDPNKTSIQVTVLCTDGDNDGHGAASCGGDDCDDDDMSCFNSCSTFFDDTDLDGFGDPATGLTKCNAPVGMVTDNTDCDDSDIAVNTAATEVCNAKDDNCDGNTNEGLNTDVDQDGHNTPASCDTPKDDCDDNDPDNFPGNPEACDGQDNDCSGAANANEVDTDSDTFLACIDCDDTDNAIHPGATEVCGDSIDQDCSGADLMCGCPDADSDGFFDDSCGGTDCDDTSSAVNPSGTEICGDGIDQDCSGADASCNCVDLDSDGADDIACGGTDCDDDNSAVNPSAAELCEDGIDQNCDGDDAPCPDPPEKKKKRSDGCAALPITGGSLLLIFGLISRMLRRRYRR